MCSARGGGGECSGGTLPPAVLQARRRGIPTTLTLLGAYVVYLLVGSAVFCAMEGPEEHHSALRLLQQKWELLENHTCLDGEAVESIAQVLDQPSPRGRIPSGSLGKRERNPGKGGERAGGFEKPPRRWSACGSFDFSSSEWCKCCCWGLFRSKTGGEKDLRFNPSRTLNWKGEKSQGELVGLEFRRLGLRPGNLRERLWETKGRLKGYPIPCLSSVNRSKAGNSTTAVWKGGA